MALNAFNQLIQMVLGIAVILQTKRRSQAPLPTVLAIMNRVISGMIIIVTYNRIENHTIKKLDLIFMRGPNLMKHRS